MHIHYPKRQAAVLVFFFYLNRLFEIMDLKQIEITWAVNFNQLCDLITENSIFASNNMFNTSKTTLA